MLKLVNLSKNFGSKKAVDNVSLTIEGNGVYGLLGPNGAGKTTLMRLIVGFYSIKKGNIFWEDKKVDSKSNTYKTIIGYLPENNPLYLNLNVLEYLEYIASLKGINKEDIESLIIDVIENCGLKKVINQKIETLSKGFRQRVGLAASLLGDPKILVLDEPTSGLDPKQIIEIRGLIKKLSKNKIVIFSTHILPEAKEICDRLLIINNGKIVLDEKTKVIRNLEKKFVELTS